MVTTLLRRPHGAVLLTLLLTIACDTDQTVRTDTQGSAPLAPGAATAPRANQTARASGPLSQRYELSYQPDWVSRISMSRLVDGSPTTTTLFANPGHRQQAPGPVIRTRVASPVQGLDFEVVLNDPGQVIKRVIVETVSTDAAGEEHEAVFTIEDLMPPPNGGSDEDSVPDAADGGTVPDAG